MSNIKVKYKVPLNQIIKCLNQIISENKPCNLRQARYLEVRVRIRVQVQIFLLKFMKYSSYVNNSPGPVPSGLRRRLYFFKLLSLDEALILFRVGEEFSVNILESIPIQHL